MDELMAKNIPITELIPKIDAYMVSLGYTESTMRHFRQAWSALKNLAVRQGELYFTHDLGYKLLREHYHIDPYARNLTESKSTYRRAVFLLLEYQVSGTIAKRNSCHNPSFPEDFSVIGEKYMEHLCTARSLKAGTIKNHRGTLNSLFSFLVSHSITDLETMDVNVINTYLKTLAGCSKSFISSRLNGISRFMEFAYKQGYVQKPFSFPAVSIFKERKVPVYYTSEESSAILKVIDRSSSKGKRDYAMILLAVRYGLRISDIKAITLSNIDFTENKITLSQIKTGKPLVLDLLPDVGWAIIDYLRNGRPSSDCTSIFVRHVVPYRSFSDADSLAYMIRQYARAAGISKPNTQRNSFHMFRYGLASTLLQENVSLTTISGILGHSELNVTTVYTQIDVPQLQICALEVPE